MQCTTNTRQEKHCMISAHLPHMTYFPSVDNLPHPIPQIVLLLYLFIFGHNHSQSKDSHVSAGIGYSMEILRIQYETNKSLFLPPFCQNRAYVANLSVLICISLFLLINILGECISSDKLQVQISPDIYLVYLSPKYTGIGNENLTHLPTSKSFNYCEM